MTGKRVHIGKNIISRNTGKIYNTTKRNSRKGKIKNNKSDTIYYYFDCLYCNGFWGDFKLREDVDINIGFLWYFQHLIDNGKIKMIKPGIWMCAEHIHKFYTNIGITTA